MLTIVAVIGFRMTYGWRYRQLDGLAANAFLLLTGDATTYGAGYSEAVFAKLQSGSSAARVVEQLGQPLWRIWWYPLTTTGRNRCCVVYLDGTAERVLGSNLKDIDVDIPASSVHVLHGEPAEETWVYAVVTGLVLIAAFNAIIAAGT